MLQKLSHVLMWFKQYQFVFRITGSSEKTEIKFGTLDNTKVRIIAVRIIESLWQHQLTIHLLISA